VPQEERIRRSRELHALIVAPLPAAAARARTIYFVPDGTLHVVPFAALARGSDAAPDYLVDAHDVAVVPSITLANEVAAVAKFDERAPVLLIADPVYANDDPRLAATRVTASPATSALNADLRTTRGGESRPLGTSRKWLRLSASGAEAVAITALFAPGSVDVLSGFSANREALLSRDLRRYRVLHFATHAVADTEAPQLSALILSTLNADGTPRAGEIFAGDLLGRPLDADMVVLSACDTALGAVAAGEGLLGLRYAAHASGARFVVASLWPVIDRVGAGLMNELYAGAVREHRSPVAALSRAMRAAKQRWPDPAFWGVFEVSSAGAAQTIH
jgi:CHAT domain-containing protein